MVKIVSRKSLGTQTVYDIGVEKDHNFILATGLVASNCFNKSHSMAYAYVTYQTAYLKANYPVEYMAALLTANSGDQDKVQKYIANCIKMSIEIEPPDINRSEVTFTPLPKQMTGAEKDKILFGMSAVKNLGDNAIANILETRQKGGPFKSLADFCERVDLKAVNSRASEALIQCGAFDALNPNRNQLMHDLEGVVKWAQNRKKDRESGQGNIFDLLGISFGDATDSYDSVPKHKPVPDFDKKEKLRLEKELLGFYVSDHPLKSVLLANQLENTFTLAQLSEKKVKDLKVIVMVTAIKLVTTKKNERMAILQLEDLTGQLEAVVFPKTYEKVHSLLQDNALLVISGKVDKRDDGMQIVVEDAKQIGVEQVTKDEEEEFVQKESEEEIMMKPTHFADFLTEEIMRESAEFVEDVEAEENPRESIQFIEVVKPVKAAQMLVVKLTPQEIEGVEKMDSLKAMLQEHSGDRNKAVVSIAIMVVNQYNCQPYRLSPELWVQDGDVAVSRLTSAGFNASVFPLINDSDIEVFCKVRSQLNLRFWANNILENEETQH
ncbi:MAG TPA: OB-fold nucleic acid binding domain-containing protein [Kamptonema sp.]|nr:OB-fold nucleic acid binding domain-containing protein [Kamptonema sp.]